MGSVTKFAALNTKIRVLERELLDDYDYNNLVKSNDLKEAIKYLTNETVYKKQAENSENSNLEEIEEIIMQNFFKHFGKIITFLPFEYKKIFKKLIKRYEVEYIKYLIRRLCTNKTLDPFISNGNNIYKYFSVDFEKISNVKSFDELLNKLVDTEYYDILDYYKNDKNRIFYMEMSLDIDYFKTLQKEMQRVINGKKNTVLEILGKNSDLLNIQWIYRALKYYNLSSEELANYVLLTGYHFNYKKLKDLCYTRDINRLVEKIKKSEYGVLFSGDENIELLMERNIERYLYNLFKNLDKNSKMNINKSISYLHQLEYEMRDLFTILEAKKYNYDIEKLKKILVRDIERR